jgi:uncharacterized membrane protein
LARAAGLLLTGYIFWILGSLGFLRNTSGSIILSWLVVLAISLTIYFRGGDRFDWRAWWRENRTVVIVGELLFIALFVGWAIIRAYQPEIHSTEKPMDLMFISSIMRSPAFPPNDGWMAGYSISYYYFGYFIAATLATVSGIASTIAFNLTISLVFALTGLTAFGVAYNLVRARQIERARRIMQSAEYPMGMAVVLGNLGRAVALAGDVEQGCDLLDDAIARATAIHAAFLVNELNVRKLEILVASGRDDDARVLSCVLYLNIGWSAQDGGTLRIHLDDGQRYDVLPIGGTLVCFLSERFEHEVLPAKRDRVALTGWFRQRGMPV